MVLRRDIIYVNTKIWPDLLIPSQILSIEKLWLCPQLVKGIIQINITERYKDTSHRDIMYILLASPPSKYRLSKKGDNNALMDKACK